jgi:hypothetical protein
MDTPENNSKENNVKSTIDAISGLVNAIPVYDDAIQPAAKEIGKSLATVTKTINIALAPISALVWGYEKINEFVLNRVTEKLKDIPEENIITPDPAVVGPALEALRYTGNNETLRELYANLIANSMDKETVKKAHPGFVEIIKNMTSDEGLILKVFLPNIYKPIMDIKLRIKKTGGEHNLINNCSYIGIEAGCEHKDLMPQYIDNLCRLGLLHIPAGRHLVNKDAYEILIKTEEYEKIKAEYETDQTTTREIKKYIELTNLGVQFKQACVIDKTNNPAPQDI